FSSVFCITLAEILLLYIVAENIKPFGAYAEQTFNNGISTLGPADRVQLESTESVPVYRQVDDLIYFSSKMKFAYETAKVKVTFKNANPTQKIYIGYKDQDTWHYTNMLIDDENFNASGWSQVGQFPTLYQKTPKYASAADFFSNPPSDAIIGLHNFDKESLPYPAITIPNYQPSKIPTIITTPIRGSFTFYAYLNKEPFVLDIQKQDLNWYGGADEMSVQVYKDKDLVYQQGVVDDGVEDASKKALPPQLVHIENPGADLPEPGVYKIVVETTTDTVVKSIKTNLHKIVFEGPLFVVENSSNYPTIAKNTKPTELFTNSLLVKAKTYHSNTLQALYFGENAFYLDQTGVEQTYTPYAGNFYKLTIPKSDVILNGIGYFAFSSDQFFTPSPYHTFNISNADDFKWTDYILTNYQAPTVQGDYKVAEQDFDISKAVAKNGLLSWIIKAPGLKTSGGNIIIKDIQVDLYKKPLIKLK
ncbi:MAG TPA: hypothetical protein VLI92_01865, partial [Candidatus Saccharimonadales bacterium]|nr:hypothetical protein [Candidatus Saccharimonadales bacterium]